MPESDEPAPGGAGSQVPLEELEKQLADLQARLPAHSIPPSMIAELDELEEALAQARQQRQAEQATQDE
jgi:ribosomal protein L29